MHISAGPAKPSIRISLFFGGGGIHVGVFYLMLQLSIQTKHQLAYCFHYKYFQLEIRKKKLILSYTFLSAVLSVGKIIILQLLGSSTSAQPRTLKHLSANFQKLGTCPHITNASVITPQLLSILTSLQMAVN